MLTRRQSQKEEPAVEIQVCKYTTYKQTKLSKYIISNQHILQKDADSNKLYQDTKLSLYMNILSRQNENRLTCKKSSKKKTLSSRQ